MCAPVILLAAGGARRMGTQKLLLEIAGQPLVRRVAEAVLASRAGALWVVTGSEGARVAAALDGLSLHRAHNRDWRRGLSHSLRCGLDALLADAPDAPGVLVVLADQPATRALHLNALLARRAPGVRVVASDYGAVLGPPVYFDAALFDALRALRGDRGARELLKTPSLQASIARVAFPEGAHDLDTPADLVHFRARTKEEIR